MEGGRGRVGGVHRPQRHGKDLGLYSRGIEKPWEDFNLGSDMI